MFCVLCAMCYVLHSIDISPLKRGSMEKDFQISRREEVGGEQKGDCKIVTGLGSLDWSSSNLNI